MRKLVLTILATTIPVIPAHAGVNNADSADSTPSLTEKGEEGLQIPKDFNMRSVQEIWNKQEKREKAVRRFSYSPQKTYPVQLRQNMHGLIVLPSWEEAQVVTLGDSSIFSFKRFDDKYSKRNMLVVQGQVPGTDTDMRIVGKSGNVYNFYLRNDPVDSKNIPTLTTYVESSQPKRFQSMDQNEDKGEDENAQILDGLKSVSMSELDNLQKVKADYLETLPQGEKYNLSYEMSGDMEVAPRGVFSDGEFTYFDYRGRLPSQRLPVIYKVVNDKDAMVNTQFVNGFLVAKTTSEEGFTLMNGDDVVCIRPGDQSDRTDLDREVEEKPDKDSRSASYNH